MPATDRPMTTTSIASNRFTAQAANPTGEPRSLLPLLQRVASLRRGYIYQVVVIVPDDPGGQAEWSVNCLGKIEAASRNEFSEGA